MLETLQHCPICEHTQFEVYLQVPDHSVSHEIFNIQKCLRCGFLFTNPRPDPSSIGKYYQSSEYISHTDTNKGFIASMYHLVRRITLKQKVKFINSMQPNKGRLLDIGCGTGYFLHAAKQDGWEVMGYEPDEKARMLAAQKTGENIKSDFLADYAAIKPVQVITLWHVLEHVHLLNETLSKINDILQPDGILILALPNHRSYDATKYQTYWAAYDVPRHLYHFCPTTITHLCKKHGFELYKQKGMPFDGFYVSMLSEKYKHGSFIRAMAIAGKGLFKSAFINPIFYSSLTYVFKKRNA